MANNDPETKALAITPAADLGELVFGAIQENVWPTIEETVEGVDVATTKVLAILDDYLIPPLPSNVRISTMVAIGSVASAPSIQWRVVFQVAYQDSRYGDGIGWLSYPRVGRSIAEIVRDFLDPKKP